MLTYAIAAERQVFKKLGRHPNLTRLFAVIINDSRNVSSLVTEFADLGSLDNVLMSLEERGENATAAVLLTAALQTSEAMLQLQEFPIVHYDLALRNLLAFEFHPEEATQVRVKLTDYGLATTGTYVQRATNSVGDGLPFRWMSPEAMQRRRFSEKSDVWAFGVVL
jgi:serine/threonine protein kinase